MADPIKPNSSITGANGIVSPAKGTYKGFDNKEYKLGLPETLQAGVADTTLSNNRALRNYQEKQGSLNFNNAINQIDRSSLQNYKGIANDYAARGMLRSGGYAKADDRAFEAASEAKVAEAEKLKGLLDTNNMADNQDQEARNNAIWEIISKFIGTEAGRKLNEIKG